tara:strand:- start:1421 stop:2053 length:633 start_codon:yes stop_codon:yes gene_type:complete
MLRDVEWWKSYNLISYDLAVAEMEKRVAAIRANTALETAWLLEHPPLYTAGTRANYKDLLDPNRLPVYQTGRGGEFTYHGPGQRIAYVMLDLKERGRDVKAYIRSLEDWLIATLAHFGIKGERREGRVGIWVVSGDREEKIAAIGVRIRRWVSYHGIALNVNPNLDEYSGIVPCGIKGYGVTSLEALNVNPPIEEIDSALETFFRSTINK